MDVPTIQKITRELGTPLYLYDGDKIKAQYQLLLECLPPGFEIFYSMKANPLLGICQLFKQWGSSIEIASGGELSIAVKAGFTPERIIFTSPGKTESELAAAVEEDIYCINIESLAEAELLNRIAKDKSKTVRVAIRINPDFNLSGAGIKMTGVASQFGIDQAQLEAVFQRLEVLANIRVRGIHIYTGTQMLEVSQLLGNLEEIVKLALELSERWRFKLEFLDLGGGFGIPYFPGEVALDLGLLRQGMKNIWNKYSERLSGTRMAVESGRFLLAEAGVFLTGVLYKKKCKGSVYLVCDGGSNLHASSAFLGRHIRHNFPMHILGKESAPETVPETVNVVGPLCTPTDVIGQKVTLAKAVPGDILVVEKSGAYGLTNSPYAFLSHTRPVEALYFGGQVHILRERGQAEDFLRGQQALS